ncbi:glycosyltransferase family 4 protein [Bacillus shivajii]|uniref:glycosyltransferase family 4 protein n=1 Tax=Bacillus shivajii TaxID=1983719 RepID=UPI001CF93D34|nr:glycosyltransferase family 4 protein [Bacillus shivajii]UCZ52838.1 glycosyltransferase family 4 protein [Bacillus shivajii]
MKVALAHFRVGETDGVSLEMEKWKLVLEQLGHEAFFIAGSSGESEAYVIEELHYQNPVNNKFVKNCYDRLEDYDTADGLKEDILNYAKIIEDKLVYMIEKESVDMLIPNNIWSLGWGLPAGIAFTNAVKKTGVKVVAHHHDFHWERERYSNPTCEFVNDLLEEYFPPDLPQVTHAVINRIAQGELRERKNIPSNVVPNVFDFTEDPWGEDEYNRDFKESIGIGENDVYVLQATRIAERKAIELGVDVVSELQNEENLKQLKKFGLYDGRSFNEDSKIVYVMAGLPEASDEYIKQLIEKAKNAGVDMRFVNDKIESARTTVDGDKKYSLWDAYVHADFITYPSILEGWGNQLLEGIYAKKPMVIYEYPVYVTDLKDKGFQFASLGDTHEGEETEIVTVSEEKVQEAASEVLKTLIDPEYRENAVQKNFEIGKKHFSYAALKDCVENLVGLTKKH